MKKKENQTTEKQMRIIEKSNQYKVKHSKNNLMKLIYEVQRTDDTKIVKLNVKKLKSDKMGKLKKCNFGKLPKCLKNLIQKLSNLVKSLLWKRNWKTN